MIPIILIAVNFVREQRWPLIAMLGYVVVFGGGIGMAADADPGDVLFFLRSLGVYGLAFTAFLAASAIHNERRSRRILAVLSKGIERGQYLAGLLAGTALAAAIYCAAIGVVGGWALARNGMPVTQLWAWLVITLAAFLLAGTVSLFFSTFLHPLVAVAAAAATLGVAGTLAQQAGPPWGAVMPAATLVESMLNFSYHGWRAPWLPAAWAIADALLFWILATLIFGRRDIAVAIE